MLDSHFIQMKNKQGKSISELIQESMRKPETKIYLPKPDVIMPGIQSFRNAP